jgi:hypothetical protein
MNYKFLTIPFYFNDIDYIEKKRSPSLLLCKDSIIIKVPSIEEDVGINIAQLNSTIKLRDTIGFNEYTFKIVKIYEYKLYQDSLYVNLLNNAEFSKEYKSGLYTKEKSFKNYSYSIDDLDKIFNDESKNNNADNHINLYTKKYLGYSIYESPDIIFRNKDNLKNTFSLLEQEKNVLNTKFKLIDINLNTILEKKEIIKIIKNNYKDLIEINGILYKKTSVPIFIQNKVGYINIQENLLHIRGSISKNSLGDLFQENNDPVLSILNLKDVLDTERDYNDIKDINPINIFTVNDLEKLDLKHNKIYNDEKNTIFSISSPYGNDMFQIPKGDINQYCKIVGESINIPVKDFYLKDPESNSLKTIKDFFIFDKNYKDYLSKTPFNIKLFEIFIDLQKIKKEFCSHLEIFDFDFIGNQLKEIKTSIDDFHYNQNYLSNDYLKKLYENIGVFLRDLENGINEIYNKENILSYKENFELFMIENQLFSKTNNSHPPISTSPYLEIKKPKLKNGFKYEEELISRWRHKLTNILDILKNDFNLDNKSEFYEDFKL